jgi:hypothetical protein
MGGENQNNFTRGDRSGKIALLIVGFLALGLGVYRISYNIKAPFIRYPSDNQFVFKTEEQKIEEKKYFDTDGDGLSDYDEEYIYGTSPYLKDSDSDDIPDKSEIEKGTDPNCPEGKSCGALPEAPENNSTSGTPEFAPDLLGQGGGLLGSSGEAVNGGMGPEQIRELLIKAGAPADSLNKISDADLLKLYQDTLQQVTMGGGQ